MFYGKLSEMDSTSPCLTQYPESVRKAFDWLKKNDLTKLPIGKTVIDGDNVYVNISEYEPKPVTEAVGEAHRQYIDIQILLSGEELVGCMPMSDDLPIVKEYDTQKDYLLVDKKVMPFLAIEEDSPNRLILKEGMFVLFTPKDLHAPSLVSKKGIKVKKAVFKCKVK